MSTNGKAFWPWLWNWVKILFLPLSLSIYLILVLWFATKLALHAWPGNPYVEPYFAKEMERMAILGVTAESIDEIDTAIAETRLLSDGPGAADSLSNGRLDELLRQTLVADSFLRSWPDVQIRAWNSRLWCIIREGHIDEKVKELECSDEQAERNHAKCAKNSLDKLADEKKTQTLTNAEWLCIESLLDKTGLIHTEIRSSVGPNPKDWSKADILVVRDEYLFPARRMLEERARLLRLQLPPLGISDVLWGFPEVEELVVYPPLSSTEANKISRDRNLSLRKGKEDLRSRSDEASKNPSEAGSDTWRVAHLFGSPELELFTLFACFGAIGAAVCGLASLAKFLGTRRFDSTWVLFYFTRPVIGAALGPLFYVVLRGGLFGQGSDWDDVNVFGYAAVSTLVGFCATEAMENLRAIGSSFFRRKKVAETSPVLKRAVAGEEFIELSGMNFKAPLLVLIDRKTVDGEAVQLVSNELIKVKREALEDPQDKGAIVIGLEPAVLSSEEKDIKMI